MLHLRESCLQVWSRDQLPNTWSPWGPPCCPLLQERSVCSCGKLSFGAALPIGRSGIFPLPNPQLILARSLYAVPNGHQGSLSDISDHCSHTACPRIANVTRHSTTVPSAGQKKSVFLSHKFLNYIPAALSSMHACLLHSLLRIVPVVSQSIFVPIFPFLYYQLNVLSVA